MGVIGRAHAKLAGSWWLHIGAAYTLCALAFLFQTKEPLILIPGIPPESPIMLVVELGLIVFIPFAIAIFLHLRGVASRVRKLKAAFLETLIGDVLVTRASNPQQVFVVADKSEDGSKIEVKTVWDADGPQAQSNRYWVDQETFKNFDAASFLRQ